MSKSQTNWTFEDTLSQIGLGYLPLFLLGFTRQRWQCVALVLVLIGYWSAFVAYPLPPATFDYESVGVPRDWPHHYSGVAAHFNKNSNLAWAFDTWFLNLFPRPSEFTHNGGGYATLSFVPTLGTMILGLIAGGWLRREAPAWKKTLWLVLAGVVLLAMGWFADYSGICPSVKRIWTPAWTLFSGGWCFLFLAGFYLVIDVGRISSWSFPLRVIGANSIAAYLLAHGSEKFLMGSFRIHFGEHVFDLMGPAYEPLLAGIIVLAIQWMVLWWLYRQRVFIRI